MGCPTDIPNTTCCGSLLSSSQGSNAQITQPSPRWLKSGQGSATPGMKRSRVFLQTQVQCLHSPRAAGRERSQEESSRNSWIYLFGSSCLETCSLLEAGVWGSFLSSCQFRSQGWKSLDATEHPFLLPNFLLEVPQTICAQGALLSLCSGIIPGWTLPTT